MIPGLEYEPADGGASSSANNHAYQYHQHQHQYPYESSPSVQSVDLTSPQQQQQQQHNHNLHRRRIYNQDGGATNGNNNGYNNNNSNDNKYTKQSRPSIPRAVRKLDIFPKAERDYTVRTERGGQLTAIGYILVCVLIIAEWMTWSGMNEMSLEHIVVDTR